jgi:pyrroloquinoline quinone (PQQ) biosynthesis protein C
LHPVAAQWVQLGAGNTLVASRRGAWIQRPELGALTLAGEMPEDQPATVETTRHLLDGAITAAVQRGAPAAGPPALTPLRWAWYLVGQWHCAHNSVALLPELIDRCRADGRDDLAQFAQLKLEEERGHDRLPLADLRALGYDAEAVVERIAPAPSVSAALAYARSCVRGADPAEFFGYVYALERRVLYWDERLLSSVTGVLPAGVDAVSGIRAHVADFDGEHVEEAVRVVSALPARDRARIALGAYRTTEILCTDLPGEHPPEAQLDEWLSPFCDRPVSIT